MNLKLSRFFLTLLAFCLFALPVLSANENTTDTIQVTREITNQNGQMELIQNEININDSNIEPLNTQKVKKDVVPNASKEIKKVLFLFLKTMGVGLAGAIIICTILLFVKKFYNSNFINKPDDEFENLDLTTPQNKQEALKSFLDKTR